METRQMTDRIAIGGQPTAADLAELKQQGYVGVVNLRQDGEPDQPMSTAEEGERVRGLGLDYVHYGVGGDQPLTEAGVGAVDEFLDRNAPGKVLVHCRRGGRAAALVLLHLARAEGWAPEEVLSRGEAMGLKLEGKMRGQVEQFLSGRGGAGS